MHKMFTRLFAVATLVCMAGVASATQFPNATCTDSVTIRAIQDATQLCHPIQPDTVRGVGGIIIGFDPLATGFDAYIQMTGGGPFSGIDFFTHSVNTIAAPYNFAIGDSIVVEFAAVAEFANATEVLAANSSFGSPNFIVRKFSSGNPLPPFFVGTTTQLAETPTNTFAEQYEGCLVQIVGNFFVARTSLTGGLGQNNGFLIVDPAAPSDSVFVDGNKLTAYAPPAVGSPVTSVQGVLNQNNRGYRIMLRNGNDITVNSPPNITDAFPITDNTVKVIYDRDVVVATATTLSNYSLSSFGSVLSAAMITPNTVLLTINNAPLGRGDYETVTVNGIQGLNPPALVMTTPQSRTFVNSLLTAEEIQRADFVFLAADTSCKDRSRFAGVAGQTSQGGVGIRASMAATASARYGSIYYVTDPGNALRGGLAAFAPPATLTIGTKYRLTGQVQEFFGETEFSNILEAVSLGASTVQPPLSIFVRQASRDTCDYTNSLSDGEDHEGRLVRVNLAKVVQRFPTPPTNGFHIVDLATSPDTIFVENFNAVLGAGSYTGPALGNKVTVTGFLRYSGGSFRIAPRNLADVVDLGVLDVPGSPRAMSFSVFPNPARTAKFSFSLPTATDVEIGIFDVAGRQVASLVNGRLAAGSYSRDWSGVDAAGRNVGAGVYFARMKAAGQSFAIRTVYLGR